MKVVCPHCASHLGDDQEGRVYRCKHCGEIFSIGDECRGQDVAEGEFSDPATVNDSSLGSEQISGSSHKATIRFALACVLVFGGFASILYGFHTLRSLHRSPPLVTASAERESADSKEAVRNLEDFHSKIQNTAEEFRRKYGFVPPDILAMGEQMGGTIEDLEQERRRKRTAVTIAFAVAVVLLAGGAYSGKIALRLRAEGPVINPGNQESA